MLAAGQADSHATRILLEYTGGQGHAYLARILNARQPRTQVQPPASSVPPRCALPLCPSSDPPAPAACHVRSGT